MLDHLDNLIRHLLIAQIDEITTDTQVGFQPPDDDWRTFVSLQTTNVLNVYLFDLRENRKLRSNERIREVNDGVISEVPAPRRLDCHYLITAWSPAVVSPATEPTVDEHALLYKVSAVLTNSEPLIPRIVYDPDPLPVTFPQVIADAELPSVLLPAEGFPKYGEFWGTMGANHRWRPAIYYIVTLPLILTKEISGPMVTTRIAQYRFSNRTEIAEVMIQIGGHVLLPPQPMATASSIVNVVGGGGLSATVANASDFRVGDVVTVSTDRATIIQIQGNDLTFNRRLTGLVPGNTLRIANLQPSQTTIRLNSIANVSADAVVIITGENASGLGTTVSERVVVTTIDASGFITLAEDSTRDCPPRANTYRLDVPPATIPPTLTPLVAGAWVRLEDQGTGDPITTTNTDKNGRFRFGGLSEGDYRLRVRVEGFAEATRDFHVPSATGEYDVPLV
jgi:hypothetical protein